MDWIFLESSTPGDFMIFLAIRSDLEKFFLFVLFCFVFLEFASFCHQFILLNVSNTLKSCFFTVG